MRDSSLFPRSSPKMLSSDRNTKSFFWYYHLSDSRSVRISNTSLEVPIFYRMIARNFLKSNDTALSSSYPHPCRFSEYLYRRFSLPFNALQIHWMMSYLQ
jgi:hypothetical protein